MNPSLIDSLIMIAVGAFFTFARGPIVAKIPDLIKKQKFDRIFKVCGLGLLACGFLLTLGSLVKNEADLDHTVRAINATTPKMVDSDTRLEKASAGPGRRLTYDLTLVSMKSHDIDRAAWKREAVPMIRANMTKNKALQTLLAAGVTVDSRYSSSDGVLIDEIIITQEDLSAK